MGFEASLLFFAMVPRLVAAAHGIHFCAVRLRRWDLALVFAAILAFSTCVIFAPLPGPVKAEWCLWSAVFVAMSNLASSVVLAQSIGNRQILGWELKPQGTFLLVVMFLAVCQVAEHRMLTHLILQ